MIEWAYFSNQSHYQWWQTNDYFQWWSIGVNDSKGPMFSFWAWDLWSQGLWVQDLWVDYTSWMAISPSQSVVCEIIFFILLCRLIIIHLWLMMVNYEIMTVITQTPYSTLPPSKYRDSHKESVEFTDIRDILAAHKLNWTQGWLSTSVREGLKFLVIDQTLPP